MKTTREVAAFIDSYTTLLELSGADTFRTRAYSNAVRIFENLDANLETLVSENKLTEIKGIGKSVALLVKEYYESGTSSNYENLRKTIPDGLLDMLRIPGLGPRKIATINSQLKIETMEQLEDACTADRLSKLNGFGKKTQENIVKGIEHIKANSGRMRIDEARQSSLSLFNALNNSPKTHRISITGSFRRARETVKDIDIVLSTKDTDQVRKIFLEHADVKEVLQNGPTKSAVRLFNGIQVDLRIVSDDEYPFALHHFTGSKEHNISLRERANKLGLKINEYGIFRDGELIECKNESDFFATLNLQYIPPELREGEGEIEAADQNKIPDLVGLDDVVGMLHMHSNHSDGVDTIVDLAEAVKARGYQYMGLTDHSQTASYAGGLSFENVKRQWDEIDMLNESLAPFRIFKGIESDILGDGSLDYTDVQLDQFDFIVASIHSQFNMDRTTMTKRIINAIQHPCTSIIGHLTGRLLLERSGYDVDFDAIFEAASNQNVSIEINSHPARLDIDWRHVRAARDAGVSISINTDAHQITGLDNLDYGIGIARKGWLRASDVVNTLSVDKFAQLFEVNL